MTKLDETFVKAALEKHPEAAYYINTLAEEVRRLETLGARYEEALEAIGRMGDATVKARLALRPIDPSRLNTGPTVADMLGASEESRNISQEPTVLGKCAYCNSEVWSHGRNVQKLGKLYHDTCGVIARVPQDACSLTCEYCGRGGFSDPTEHQIHCAPVRG